MKVQSSNPAKTIARGSGAMLSPIGTVDYSPSGQTLHRQVAMIGTRTWIAVAHKAPRPGDRLLFAGPAAEGWDGVVADYGCHWQVSQPDGLTDLMVGLLTEPAPEWVGRYRIDLPDGVTPAGLTGRLLLMYGAGGGTPRIGLTRITAVERIRAGAYPGMTAVGHLPQVVDGATVEMGDSGPGAWLFDEALGGQWHLVGLHQAYHRLVATFPHAARIARWMATKGETA